MFRSALTTTVPLHSLSVPASRSLHASPASYKTVTEKVKDAAQTVNSFLFLCELTLHLSYR